ncbi:MAG: hypothetical protein ACUVSX_16690 [Aggregatilineales bacterium]
MDNEDNEAQKESRRILRRVQDHIIAADTQSGAQREAVGLADVVYHPSNASTKLNYVTPRRSTAWVSSEMVQQGIARLQQRGRAARVRYIEGLYPPLFGAALRELGLVVEHEMPLMVYLAGESASSASSPATAAPLPDGVSATACADQRSIELWWYAWRNAHFDALTLGAEPALVGRDLAAVTCGQQLNLLLYRDNFPVGAARLSVQSQGAYLMGMALMKEARTSSLLRALVVAVARAALDRGCNLICAPGETEADRLILRALGFRDFGSLVCYAPAEGTSASANEASYDCILGQPVFPLR